MNNTVNTVQDFVHTDPMIPFMMKVRKISWETDDTYTIVLEHDSDDSKPFIFKPGQFNMLYAFGHGEAAISISSDAAKNTSITHTIHRVGHVTTALSQLKKGDVVGVRGPFGSSWPVDEAKGKDVIFVVGGIGLAPLRPALYHIFRNRKNYERVILLYGSRTALDILYRIELDEWVKRHKIDVQITVDRSDTSWRGNVGVVTNLFNYIKLDARQTLAMVCGPEIMMKYSIDELKKIGIPNHNIYLSMERNMKCAVGFCGHCQYGANFICKDGPVFNYSHVKKIFDVSEL
jgi:NAD(P)H-flavin reductase